MGSDQRRTLHGTNRPRGAVVDALCQCGGGSPYSIRKLKVECTPMLRNGAVGVGVGDDSEQSVEDSEQQVIRLGEEI